jgi:hypothetical protein
MDHARGSALAVAAAVAAAGIAGCGGARQDAKEPSGQFKVAVSRASFPLKQSLSQPATLRIEVRNDDKRTLPDIAVTVETRPKAGGGAPLAFGSADTGDTRLADTGKPVWVLDHAPKGGDSAYTNTWALGQMFPGETKTFTWKLLPVQPGDYTIDYRVSPGLNGKAKVAHGQRSHGAFKVSISDQPVPARVGDDGKVVRGVAAGSSGQ